MTLYHAIFPVLRLRMCDWMLATVLCTGSVAVGEQQVVSGPMDFASQEYAAHRASLAQSPTNAVEAWKFGRAAFDLADFTTNQSRKVAIVEKGIDACRQSLSNGPSAAGHFYLALNLGRLAETRGLSALHLLHEMEQELILARSLDPSFDHAGADRTLGLIYRDAPGWPISLGDTAKATKHLESCVNLDGDFPENRLALAELYAGSHRTELLVAQMSAIEALWEDARHRFTGIAWERSWQDWERRRSKLKALLPSRISHDQGRSTPGK